MRNVIATWNYTPMLLIWYIYIFYWTRLTIFHLSLCVWPNRCSNIRSEFLLQIYVMNSLYSLTIPPVPDIWWPSTITYSILHNTMGLVWFDKPKPPITICDITVQMGLILLTNQHNIHIPPTTIVIHIFVTGPTCGAGHAHSFRNTWFHSLRSWFHCLPGVHDFTHSCTLYNLSVLGICLRINGSGLFAWISPTASLGLTLFI